MVIKFTCPCDKRRKMQVPDNRAGKNAKCPECGLPFIIPKPDPTAPSDRELRAEELLEFLCPNEECPKQLLQAPASMAGRRGQCPHCGSKFRVPLPQELRDDTEEGEHTAQAAGDSGAQDGSDTLGRAVAEARSTEVVEDVEEIEEAEEAVEAEAAEEPEAKGGSGTQPPVLDFNFIDPGGSGQKHGSGSHPSLRESSLPGAGPMELVDDVEPPLAVNEHPMAALFEKIWDESEREAVVELRLTTGEMITPVHYSHDFSRGQHGIFGSLDREGKHILEVIPWDNIARVTVRGLNELPPTLFDVPGN